MSLNAATIKVLVAKGLSAEDILEVALASEEKTDRTNAERQARFREGKRNALRNAVIPPNDSISNPPPVSSETGLAAQPKSSKRGSRLADGFEAPDDWIAWAVSKRGWSKADAAEEAECFARYWQAKPGREACKLDWPKTWQNWVTNSRRVPAHRGSTDPPKFSAVLMEERRKREAATG